MTVTDTPVSAWLLLIFSLPAKRASQRVEVWRKLQHYGALPLHGSGYVLPNSQSNQERFEWLAVAIRKYKGQASVLHVHSIDDLPHDRLVQQFVQARARDYDALTGELKALSSRRTAVPASKLTRIRKRYQQIVEIDFYPGPARSRVETMLMSLSNRDVAPSTLNKKGAVMKKQYSNRKWLTRPRPGIDRVSSAWLIRKFIDPKSKYVFDADPDKHPDAVPFDTFSTNGFGHRGDDCTFETLCKEFVIKDKGVRIIAEIIHDADLHDEKFGRTEGVGLDKTLKGWAKQGLPDVELLERGMELIEGLYSSVS